jgi:cell division septal protein FtsQ
MTVGTIEKRTRRPPAAPAVPVDKSRGWLWALVQLSVLSIEIFLALFLLAQPAFRPTDIRVMGNQHVGQSQVVATLDLPQDRNLFFLNHADLQRRLETLPWVREASVTLALPDRLVIRLTEWTPSAVLQVGETSYYLNGVGQILDPATEPGSLAIINRPDLAEVKSGQAAVAAPLLPMLVQLRAGFPTAFKVTITSFSIDSRNVLTAQTDHGWSLVFGQMVTGDDRATLEPKLASLRALSTRLDLTSRQILYINLENPGAPAVQMRGRR